MVVNNNTEIATVSSGVIIRNNQTADYSKYNQKQVEDEISSIKRGYFEDGNIQYENFDTDKNGIFEHKISYLPNGYRSLESFHDNENGNILEMIHYDANNVLTTTKYTYDENDRTKTQTVYNERGKIKSNSIYSYDSAGNLAKKSIDKDGDGEIDYYEIYKDGEKEPEIKQAKSILTRFFEFIGEIFKSIF